MLLYILLGLVAVIAVLCAVIATRPDDFKVTRSATFKASPAAVFEQVNDFHKWDAWRRGPRRIPTPTAVRRPDEREGAKFSWAGDGEWRGEHDDRRRARRTRSCAFTLDFMKPMAGPPMW